MPVKLTSSKNRRAWVALLVLALLATTGAWVHNYRKQRLAKQALGAGMVAFGVRQFTDAADQLGMYLTVDEQNLEVLATYAEAEIHRRPRSRGDLQQAISALETVLRLNRGDPAASDVLTGLYVSLRMPGEAERVARAWAGAHPEDVRATARLADTLIAQQKLDDAVRVLRANLGTHANEPQIVGRLALVWYEQNKANLAEAQQLLNDALAAGPRDAGLHLWRARLLASAGQTEEARQELQAAQSLGTADWATWLDIGRLRMDVGQYDRAAEALDQAERAAPAKPEVYIARAQIALDLGDAPAGATLADRALAAPLGEERQDVLPLAAELYLAAQRLDEAEDCLRELREHAAPSEVILYVEGLVHLARGQTFRAAAVLEDVARRAPRMARGYLALARAYAHDGDIRRAISPLREYLRLAGTTQGTVAAQLRLAGYYASLERWRDAARVAATAERLAPFRSAAVLTSIEAQGMVARPGGPNPNPSAIRDLLEHTRTLAAGNPADVRLQLLLARLAAWSGDWKQALEIVDRERGQAGQAATVTLALAGMYEEAGRYDDAIKECLAALAREPSSALQTKLAEVYVAKGDMPAAIKVVSETADHLAGKERRDVLLKMSRLLILQDQPEQAGKWLLQVLSDDRLDVQAIMMLLASGYQPERRQEWVEQLRGIEGQDGLNWRLWQARVWLDSSDWSRNRQRIESLLNDCLTRYPNDEDVATALANLYEKEGEVGEALAMYHRAMEGNASDMRLARRFLDLATRGQRWSDANRVLDRLPVDDPSLAEFRVRRAIREGNPRHAERLLERILAARPQDTHLHILQAGLKQRRGETAEAERLLDEADRLAPGSLDVLTARVDLYLAAAQPDRALTLCTTALSRGSSPAVLTVRAHVFEALDRPADAERDLREAARSAGWEERAWVAVGEMYWRRGQPGVAIERWREGLSAVPGSFALRADLVVAMLGGDGTRREEGLKLLAALSAENPADQTVLMLRASQLEASRPAEAANIYEDVTRRYPGAAGAYEALARLAVQRGQRAEALGLLERGLGNNPEDLDLLLARCDLLAQDSPARAAVAAREAAAIAHQLLNLHPGSEAAAVALGRALAISDGPARARSEVESLIRRPQAARWVDARIWLAQACTDQAQYPAGEDWIRQAETLAPGDPRSAQARIYWCARQNKFDQALSIAQTYAQAHPRDTSVVLSAARAIAAAKDKQTQVHAIPLLELVLQRGGENTVVQAELAMAYYQQGQITEAESALTKALRLQPDNLRLLNNLTWLVCEHDRNPEAAEKLAAPVIRSSSASPELASLLDTWGVVQYRLGIGGKSRPHLEESQRRLEQCLRDPRTSPATRASASFHLARTLFELDRKQSRVVLDRLMQDPASKALLSSAEQQEAQRLLEQLASEREAEASVGRLDR